MQLCVCVSFMIYMCMMLFILSLWEPLSTVWYSKNTGGRIPNGITGRDAYWIPEWLKTHPLLALSLSQLTLPPPLILVTSVLTLSLCPMFISSVHFPSFSANVSWKQKHFVCVAPRVVHAITCIMRMITSYISLKNEVSFALAVTLQANQAR